MLSLVIPFHNHKESLPRLLDSALAQSIASDMEVVLVDDCSDESSADLVEAYRNKGLRLTFLRLPERRYTRYARLAGVAEAAGQAVTFADADDVLWGSETLAFHTRLLLEEHADIVHASTVLLNADLAFVREYHEARPLAPRLAGADIFRRCAEEAGHKPILCGKIFARPLMEQALDEARRSSVRRYREDMLLCTLLFFHARTYVGSTRVGYGYHRVDRDVTKAGGRAVSSWYMLRELVPYLERNGCPPDVLAVFAARMRRFMVKNLRMFCTAACEAEFPCISENMVDALLEHGEYAAVMRMLRETAENLAPPRAAMGSRMAGKIGEMATRLRSDISLRLRKYTR